MREKELNQLDRDVRIYELKNAVTNKILSKIQADEIKRTIDRGSILQGRWDGVVYAGVDNQYVQQRLLDGQNLNEQQQAQPTGGHQSYQDWLARKPRTPAAAKLTLDDPRVAQKVKDAQQLGLERIYDGFTCPKTYKYQQYNRIIEKLKKGKKRCDPSEIIHGKEFVERKREVKKWLHQRRQAKLQEYQKRRHEGGSMHASDGALSDDEQYDSGVDQDHLKQMLDTDEQLQQQIDGALFTSSIPGKKSEMQV